jgi:hypothetical protein
MNLISLSGDYVGRPAGRLWAKEKEQQPKRIENNK